MAGPEAEPSPEGKRRARPKLGKADAAFAAKCEGLRRFYTKVNREEWWWVMDESIAAVAAQLKGEDYCVIDGFLKPGQARALQEEVEDAHKKGRLEPAGLVNGKVSSSEAAKYSDTATRGDVIGWFDADETSWPHGRELEAYLLKLGTLVSELKGQVPELKRVTSRSKAMVACYPGGGARYVKHVDNDGRHPLCRTRVLTGLMYLNDEWRRNDGGELVVLDAKDKDVERRVVEPLSNRLVLFWSDWRVPHEVRAANKSRYAVTLWFLDTACKGEPAPEPVPAAPTAPALHPLQPEPAQAPAKAAAEPSKAPAEPPQAPAQAAAAAEGEPGRKQEAAPQAPQEPPPRYEWLPPQQEAEAWELKVELPETAADGCVECPELEVSERQLRLLSGRKPLLTLPLPVKLQGEPACRWSRKKRTLTVRLTPAVPACELAEPAELAKALKERDWGLTEAFLPAKEADELRQCLLAMRGRLRLGSNGHEGPTVSGRAKNDEYAFLSEAELKKAAAEPLRRCQRRLNELVLRLLHDGALPDLAGLQLTQGKPMVAVYPGDGARYARHYDATSSGAGFNGRVLTFVVYLNPFWREEHGGCLRLLESLEGEKEVALVEPLHGRLVAFRCCDRCPHEVLPSRVERLALTLWYYDGARLVQRCDAEEIEGFGFEAE